MNDGKYKFLIVLLAGAVIAAFFLPWIKVESKPLGIVTELLTGKYQATVETISGFKIPILANSEESRVIDNIARILKPDIQEVDKKSYLVWLVPILALIILVMALRYGTNELLNLLFAVVGCAIFAYSLHKLQTTDLDKLLFQVKLGSGGWLTLLAYLGIGILGFARFITLAEKGKR